MVENPNELDLKRAEAAMERAKPRLKEGGEMDIPRALAAAERARARVSAAATFGR